MSNFTIGIIGGTGKLGSALAGRWIKAGLTVGIGSRTKEKSEATAKELAERYNCEVTSGDNVAIATEFQLLVITVPFSAQEATLQEIKAAAKNKIVVDTTVPLKPPKVMRVQLPEEGCAAIRTQNLLGEDVTVVSAFQNVAAHRLAKDDDIECDIMVFGDDKSARHKVVELANQAGLRGIHAGPLVNSAAAEALTSILIFVNKNYSVDGAGIQFTGDFTFHSQ